jgi:hypothetical protein
MPKIFKWYKDDFGFSKQEILAYYASFMQPDVRADLTEIARSNNFLIKYDKYDWNLNLAKACSEAARQPVRQLITNSPASASPARQQQPAPSPPQQQQRYANQGAPPQVFVNSVGVGVGMGVGVGVGCSVPACVSI